MPHKQRVKVTGARSHDYEPSTWPWDPLKISSYASVDVLGAVVISPRCLVTVFGHLVEWGERLFCYSALICMRDWLTF